tara:strand:- start:665 stop:787 length:123 start_codon:yes stop_codon:yes gene_type:complete
MIKNFILIVILLTLTISCGKKADPEYMESKNKYTNQKSII